MRRPTMAEYLASIAFVSALVHLAIRRYVVASVMGAALGTAATMLVEAARVDFQVKPGWVAPLFLVGFVVALPAGFLAGVPFRLWRNHRNASRAEPGRNQPVAMAARWRNLTSSGAWSSRSPKS
ncbi:hypothetical protein [Paludisphaera mucosa]|uniref:Threonine/Serine exporter ThrE domain-containing protein n=1 Tax=Paludisphaera mucosa TaxID=3030827 RepID=A0ABT6F4H6_9BACT|nr:hypothetical protein [Paludisphaera mucosa]MDG3002498.1 hypothetical protein [Paludisphaera mucosa]